MSLVNAPGLLQHPVFFGLRPLQTPVLDDLIAFVAPGAAVNSVAGRIGAAAYLGDRNHFYVEIRGRDRPVAVATQNVERADVQPGGGDRAVWLHWSEDAVVLLPPE